MPYIVPPRHPISDLLALMKETDDELVAALPSDMADPTYGKLVCYALLADSLALQRGVRVLLEQGLGDEAGVLTRKQMEVSAVLVYVGGQASRREELAAQYMYHLYKKELSLWRADKKAGFRKEAEEAKAEILDEMRTLKQWWLEAGNQGKVPSFPSTAELLRRMGQGRGQFLLERGHLYAHVSRMGLEGRLRGRDTDQPYFDTNGDPDQCVSVGAVTLDLLLAAGQGSATALEWGDQSARRVMDLRGRVTPQIVGLLRRRTKNAAV